MTDSVTIALVGLSGGGKSAIGNAYLGTHHFEEFAGARNPRSRVCAAESRVNNGSRCVIDTPGLTGVEAEDAENLHEIVRYLREDTRGVNAFGVVINSQDPRLDGSIRRLVRILNDLFNNESSWEHVCLIFTRCFHPQRAEAEELRDEYGKHFIRLIAECQRKESLRLSMPCFGLDVKALPSDQKSAEALRMLHGFSETLPTLRTQQLVTPYPGPWRIAKQKKAFVLVNKQDSGDTRTLTYENQEREKRTTYDGYVDTFTEWKGAASWTQVQKKGTKTETKTECLCEQRKANRHIQLGPRPYLFGLIGECPVLEVDDGDTVVRKMAVMERTASTDFDGNVSYSDWAIVRTYDE
jgi:GTPase SAR1 family protein